MKESLKKHEIINRVTLFRGVVAYSGNPSKARSSEEKIFEEAAFESLFGPLDEDTIIMVYFAMSLLDIKKPKEIQGFAKYSLLFAASQVSITSGDNLKENGELRIIQAINKWPEFEHHIKGLEHNKRYVSTSGFNYDGYYKGSTVAKDISEYDWSV